MGIVLISKSCYYSIFDVYLYTQFNYLNMIENEEEKNNVKLHGAVDSNR